MTRTEQIHRRMFENKRDALLAEKRDLRDDAMFSLSWNDLPAKARKALLQLRKLERERKRLRDEVAETGFKIPNLDWDEDLSLESVYYHQTDRFQRIKEAEKVFDERFRKLSDLQDSSAVNLLGMAPPDAKAMLEMLLKKVQAI